MKRANYAIIGGGIGGSVVLILVVVLLYRHYSKDTREESQEPSSEDYEVFLGMEQPSELKTLELVEKYRKLCLKKSEFEKFVKKAKTPELLKELCEVIREDEELAKSPIGRQMQSLTAYPGSLSVADMLANGAHFQRACKQFPRNARPEHNIEAIVAKDEANRAVVEGHARGVRIIVDQRVMKLAAEYLAHKQAEGNAVEKRVYEGMSVDAFVNRLLMKRPMTFYSARDRGSLRTPLHRALVKGRVIGTAEWETVGTMEEQYPMVLREYLSYEEMAISALVNVSVPTFFINKGNRRNASVPGAAGEFEPQGIFIGAVGARFQTRNMDTRHMVGTAEPEIAAYPTGLKKVWDELYGVDLAAALRGSTPGILVEDIYKLRMELSYRPILLHAQKEGVERGRRVVLRLVGLGTGVWAFRRNPEPQELVIRKVIEALISANDLSQLDLIEFLWMAAPVPAPHTTFRAYQIQTDARYFKPQHYSRTTMTDKNGHVIQVENHQGSVADPVVGEKLLVTMYAWDGNSFPGNEYWDEDLVGSADPAAACCSTTPELQNPYINTQLRAPQNLLQY